MGLMCRLGPNTGKRACVILMVRHSRFTTQFSTGSAKENLNGNAFAIIIAAMSSLPSLEGLDRSAFRPDRQDPYLRMFKSTVFVRDHDRSLRFYVDQLGFSMVADVRFDSSDRWVAVAPPEAARFLRL
jgi:hypothetical protein